MSEKDHKESDLVYPVTRPKYELLVFVVHVHRLPVYLVARLYHRHCDL